MTRLEIQTRAPSLLDHDFDDFVPQSIIDWWEGGSSSDDWDVDAVDCCGNCGGYYSGPSSDHRGGRLS
jgi:hypothetical protein